ncbi:MAG: Gfo/Idh/MocA family oxidoreductase [Chloroflexi bacterium]|nr:Gfo/Idh/MocA family oxidoreductase [Chloroflexota bacterium]
MAEQTLRIGFVGAGAINRTRHVPGLKKCPGVEFEVVANRSQASSQAAADEYGIKRTAGNWMEVVEDPNVDIVWIGTHPSMHREITIAALEAGKHVFTQARMAMDYADAKLMWEAAKKYPHLTTNISAPPHYMRGDRVVRRMLAEGYVGQPVNVVVQSFSDSYANPTAPRHWRQEGPTSGLNTLDVGMMIEVMHRWLGYAKRVTALEKTVYPTRPAPDGSGAVPVERPDTLSVVAELENGALATMLFSGVARHAREANRFEIYGTDGTIRYLQASDTILAGKAGDPDLKPVEVSAADAREWTVEEDFIKAVRSGRRATEPSFWDGLKYMEMTEAVFGAAKTGRAVDLPFDRLERDDQ